MSTIGHCIIVICVVKTNNVIYDMWVYQGQSDVILTIACVILFSGKVVAQEIIFRPRNLRSVFLGFICDNVILNEWW